MKYLRFIFACGLALICLMPLTQIQAAVKNCSDSTATWNTADGINPGFTCKVLNYEQNKTKYTFIATGKYNCPGCPNCACVRMADCESAYGAEGYECVNLSDPKYSGVNFSKLPFHCPGRSNVICAKVNDNTTNDSALEPALDTPTSTGSSLVDDGSGKGDSGIEFTLSGCCRQIVPEIDHTKYNYSLNHVVQLGINIYKCILCVVGSVMILMIVLGGFTMIMAAGQKGKIDAGKKMISAAIVGGIIVVASVLIVGFAVELLGGSFADKENLQINASK